MTKQAYVPTIDISPLFGDDRDAKLDVALQIDTACRGSGFFYAANHGVDLGKLQDMTTHFYQIMSDSEKWELAINAYNQANPRVRNGYYRAIEGKKANESYCYLNPLFTERHPLIEAGLPMHEVNIWPDEERHPGLQAFYETYYREVFHVSSRLLRGFALALEKDESFFDQYFTAENTLSAVSLIRYPYLENYPPVKTSEDGTKLSFGSHQDVSLITVLYQTPILNLQVEIDGTYEDVPVSADHFLVNCGTYMAHVTNDYYRAPWHRVKFVNTERLSIPFFVNLAYDSAIDPFNQHADAQIDRNQVISYGQYFQNGFKALIDSNGQT